MGRQDEPDAEGRLREFDERYAALAQSAMRGMPARADALEATDVLEDWRRIAHQVRGLAPPPVGALAEALEAASARGDRPAAELAHPVLVRALRRLGSAAAKPPRPIAPEPARRPPSARPLEDGRAAAARILVADDDPAIRRMLSLILRRRGGHEVVAVSDGDAAAHELAKGGFDLALVDAMMPGRAGVDVARGASCTTVVLSAASPSELGLDDAPARWWRKPLLADELITRVDALLLELRTP